MGGDVVGGDVIGGVVMGGASMGARRIVWRVDRSADSLIDSCAY